MKRSQITIFAIVGLVLMVGIILFFVFRLEKIPTIIKGFEENPQKYLESCLEKKIEEGINILERQGGEINPKLYKLFKFEEDRDYANISFLCYTSKYYVPCYNQRPLLISFIEGELEIYLKEEKNKCLNSWKEGMEKRGYSVVIEDSEFKVELAPEQVKLILNGSFEYEIKEEVIEYSELIFTKRTKLYNLAIIAYEIVSQESEYCTFNTLGYSITYPDIKVSRFRTSDLINLYTIEDEKTQEKFRFAVRGCVLPQTIY